MLRLLERARSVVLVMDNDEAGRGAAQRLSAELGGRGEVLELPAGVKDVSELGARPGGRDAFFRLLGAVRRDADVARALRPPISPRSSRPGDWRRASPQRGGCSARWPASRSRSRSQRAERIPPDRADLDPVRVLGPEQAVVVGLQPSTGDILSLRSDWRNEPPLTGVLARAMPRGDERVVCRLTLVPPPAGAAGRLHRRAAPAGASRREPAGAPGPSELPLVGALAIAAGVLQGWQWYAAGEWLLLAGGACVFVGLPLAGALAMRMLRSPEPLPPRVVEQKLGSPLAAAWLEVHAIGGRGSGPDRLRLLAAETAAAYGAYDSAGGDLRPAAPHAPRRRPERKLPLLLNTAELAGLWHLPDHGGAPAGIRRTTAQRLPPAPEHASRGARVGTSDADGGAAPVHPLCPSLA